MARTKCRIGFLPSIWPETFSFVLSELLAFGLYPVVFNLGAQAERLSAAGTGSILEIGLSAMSINDHLLSIAIPRPAIPEAYGPAGAGSDAAQIFDRYIWRGVFSILSFPAIHQNRRRVSRSRVLADWYQK